MSEDKDKTQNTRYVSLAEHEELHAQFIELVNHINKQRFYGSSIELPENLQALVTE